MAEQALRPGSSDQWMFSVGIQVDNHEQYYALMVRLDGLAGVAGPFDTWDEAVSTIRMMAEEVQQAGGDFSTIGEYTEENGVKRMHVRHQLG